MSFLKKLPVNIFTLMAFICAIALCFRLVNMATFKSLEPGNIGVVMSAAAIEEVSEQPPPLTRADLEAAVAETARAANDTNGTDTPPARPLYNSTNTIGTVGADPSSFENRAFSAAEVEVLQSLSKRREELDKREKGIAERRALLTAAEREVDRKIAELNKLRAELETLLGQQQTMEEDRIKSLVKIYEGMKPKEAAAIFNTLDMEVLLLVISRMNERRSSPILAAMTPEKARTVTMRLAEQRTLPDAHSSLQQP